MIKKMMQKTIISTCLSLLFTSVAFASIQTAVTANLVKSEVDGSVLICEYRTMDQTHFKVLFSNQTCPLSIQVGH